MKFFNTITGLVVFICMCLSGFSLYGQGTAHAKNGMNVGLPNYTSFTAPYTNTSAEALQNNKGFEQHPEMGKLFAETPCDNCYELIGKRTETTKTFVKDGTGGRGIMQQTSNAPMHYKDAKGNWLTIKSQLQPDNAKQGIYAATEQEVPLSIYTGKKRVSLGKAGQHIEFNNNLELIYVKADGSRQSLGNADWTKYSAGDDGVYVTDAWPGIDIEMFVIRGSVKTNFRINHALPAYAAGKLLVRDHLYTDDGMMMALPQGNVLMPLSGKLIYTGNIELNDKSGTRLFTISAASAFEKNNVKNTLRMLEYYIDGDSLDIALPGDFLNRPSSSYPVIIDPLISTATVSAVSGTTYSAGWTVGCVYTNPASVPAKVTITDIQFSFQYITSGGAILNNGAFDFKLGTCRSPTPSALYWNCNSLLTGSCTGTGASIFSSLFSCAPPPSCSPFNLNVTMDFYQDYASDPPCSNLYITAGTPLTITVFANTIDPGTISATSASICQGQSTTISFAALHGVGPYSYVWMPGGMTGTSITISPLATTTYTVTATDACGDVTTATQTIVVNATAPITGTTTICIGNTTNLTDAITGGTWSSGSTAIATVVKTSGVVTGVAPGTSVITYTSPAGCNVTTTVTVLPVLAPITGPSSVCEGSTIALSDAATGGTWTSGNTTVATIGISSGIVTGVIAGTSVIKYTSPGGCSVTTTITVNPVAPITGTLTICAGGTTALHNTVTGGTWSSGNTTVATVGLSSGLVSGVTVGTAIITYTTSAGCTSTATVSVTLLTPITGITTVCQGSTTTLSDPTTGGTWASSTTTVATAGITSGVVTGISGGTATITYYAATGCYATTTVTVNPIGSITGTPSVCIGSTTALSDATPGGTWSSSNTVVAIVGLTTGVVTGEAAGTAIITYTTSAGCTATITVTVNTVLPITGTKIVCHGNTITLSDGSSGGTWTSSNSAVATVGLSSGIVTGVASSTATITYSISGCSTTTVVTVNPLEPITGPTTVCIGFTITLSDATIGGTWSSSNTAVATIDITSGVVTGIAAGTATISYTTPLGCIATIAITVDALYPIFGTTTVCQGSGTILSNLTAGGTWTSSNTAIATIDAGLGIVSGISPGTSSITYTTPGGCYATTTVTVNPLAPITGITTICQGMTTALSDPAGSGGTWSSMNTAVATIDASGVVTGVTAGTCIIDYTTPAGCIAGITITVNALFPITGITTICQGNAALLSDLATGGTWSSANTSVASIGFTSGLVIGLAPGTAAITYTTPGGCVATTTVTVNPLAPITGVTAICEGSTTTLSDVVTGGTWSSSNTVVATIDISLGIVSGISGGTSAITYTTPAGCQAIAIVTVNPLGPVTGTTTVCQGNMTVLSDAGGAGTWTSDNTTVAIIGFTSGVVTGLSPGTSAITYTTPAGCIATTTVTVNPLQPITGPAQVCQGLTITLSDATPGGSWSSVNTTVATIDATTGVLTGMMSGTSVIQYTTSLGCVATITVTVNAIGPIGGTTTVCQGSTTALSDIATGGTWTSTATSIATIGFTTGVVSGIAAGTSTISYVTAAGCMAATTVTIYPLAPISGITALCAGSTTILSDPAAGGTWTSSNTVVATIGYGSAVVNALSAGITTIQYTTPSGCTTAATLTVNPFPSVILGNTSVCVGSTTTLSNTVGGGTWGSSNTTVATIGLLSGVVTGLSANTTSVTYTTAGGCAVFTTITVNPLPAIVTGVAPLCQGSAITLSDATPGGSWSSSSTTVATVDPVTGVVTGVASGITSIIYTTPAGCTANALVTVNPLPYAITGTATVCVGLTTALSNALGGGTWSSSVSTVATIGAGTGVLSGITAGTTIISYITPSGCYSVTTALVNPTPVIGSVTFTGPTTCVTTDGTITITGLTPGETYAVRYKFGSLSVANTLTADGSGNIIITNLAAGSYTAITVTTSLGCTSNVVAGPLVLSLPPTPATPVAGNNSPVCDGGSLQLTATDATTGITYSWTGVSGFTSALQNPAISPAALTASGTYTITATKVGCVSAPATTSVVIHPIPNITSISSTNPTTCEGVDGTITVNGLTAGIAYTITYLDNSKTESATLTANTTGSVTITELSAGVYTNINAASFTCISNTMGPVTLKDPLPAPPPVLSANNPICVGYTLQLKSADFEKNISYEWTGPNGFTSSLQDPAIPNMTMADSGIYMLTIKYLNCPSGATINVGVYPAVTLTNVTASQTIHYGTSVQLNAAGASLYIWTPNDGTLSNPAIYNPIATPVEPVTVYIVQGLNEWGCFDTASVTLTLSDITQEFVPGAFSPNNDGRDDVFRIGNAGDDKLIDFRIFNRWGNLIYHNNYDITKGWDGTFNGVPQDLGTYQYQIILGTPGGGAKTFKGDVILVR